MSEGLQPAYSSSGLTMRYVCKLCGKRRDAQKVYPVFDFTRGVVHCGCAKGES